MTQEELARMKTGEIADRARKAGIKGVEHMNKQQMIAAMAGGKGGRGAEPGQGGQKARSAMPGQGGGQGDSPQPPGTKPQDWKNIPGNQS